MIFTFTLYFLVYGRELVDRASGLMPPAYREPFVGAVRRIYGVNKGYWYGKFLIGRDRRPHDLRHDEAARTALRRAALTLRRDHRPDPQYRRDARDDPGRHRRPARGALEGSRRSGGVLLLYQQVENNLITPKVFKETVEIHPFLSVVTVIVFTSLFGIVGALIAVPVTKAIEILIAAVRQGRATAVLEPPLPEPE